MGIYIKGMEMPKDDVTAYCEIIISNNYIGNGCIQMLAHDAQTNELIGEAIELPPHGRLIDADALIEAVPPTNVDIFENCRRCELLDQEQVIDLINDAPTIIESEGEDG